MKGSEPTKATTTTSGQALIEKGAWGFISFQDLKDEHVVWPCFFFHAPSKPPPEHKGRQSQQADCPKPARRQSLFGLANQGQGYCV